MDLKYPRVVLSLILKLETDYRYAHSYVFTSNILGKCAFNFFWIPMTRGPVSLIIICTQGLIDTNV